MPTDADSVKDLIELIKSGGIVGGVVIGVFFVLFIAREVRAFYVDGPRKRSDTDTSKVHGNQTSFNYVIDELRDLSRDSRDAQARLLDSIRSLSDRIDEMSKASEKMHGSIDELSKKIERANRRPTTDFLLMGGKE